MAPPPAIAEARIAAALRAGGYRIPDIQLAITAVRELTDVSSSVAALDAHLNAIGHRGLALLRAGAWLAEIAANGRPAPAAPAPAQLAAATGSDRQAGRAGFEHGRARSTRLPDS